MIHGIMVILRPFHQYVFGGGVVAIQGMGGAGEGEFQADDITGEKALLLIQGSKNSPGDLEGMSVM